MAAFEFRELPIDKQNVIMEKLDTLEVAKLRTCDRIFRGALNEPNFVRLHNNRVDNGRGCYSLTERQIVVNAARYKGVIRGLRVNDESNSVITIDLQADLDFPDDSFTLVCCSSSHFVFSLISGEKEAEQHISLVVYDFTKPSAMPRLIDCPPVFIDHMENIKITVFAIQDELHFKIIHVFMDEDVHLPDPRISMFDSRYLKWSTILVTAHVSPHQGLHIDLHNETLMIIAHGQEYVYFVTTQNEVPLYFAHHIDYLFQENINLNMNALNLRTGWNLMPAKHFATGNQGWAASIITHVNSTGASRIKHISLFEFNPVSIRYEYKSTAERYK